MRNERKFYLTTPRRVKFKTVASPILARAFRFITLCRQKPLTVRAPHRKGTGANQRFYEKIGTNQALR
ncbi:MAG: hypothetical protein B6D41_10750 [Chloroflexi bacterium UTCFX4]|nr:MAG: hypothetical protein B6D41_10750 [Chloroflexi bacterium UTCFX4]